MNSLHASIIKKVRAKMRVIKAFGDLKCNLRIATLRGYVNRLHRKRIARTRTELFLLSNGFAIVELLHRGKPKLSYYRYHGLTRRLHNPKRAFDGCVIKLDLLLDNS